MKKEKKVKLFVEQSKAQDVKSMLRSNGIKYWTDWNHLQFDAFTGIVTFVGTIIIVIALATL